MVNEKLEEEVQNYFFNLTEQKKVSYSDLLEVIERIIPILKDCITEFEQEGGLKVE